MQSSRVGRIVPWEVSFVYLGKTRTGALDIGCDLTNPCQLALQDRSAAGVEESGDLGAAFRGRAVVILRPTTGPRSARSAWLLSSQTSGLSANNVSFSQRSNMSEPLFRTRFEEVPSE